MKIPGTVTIISGGSSGLAQATAKSFAEQGSKVVVLDVNSEAGEAFAATHENIEFCICDVSDEEAVRAAVEFTVNRFGQIDIAIACAGITLLETLTDEEGNA